MGAARLGQARVCGAGVEVVAGDGSDSCHAVPRIAEVAQGARVAVFARQVVALGLHLATAVLWDAAVLQAGCVLRIVAVRQRLGIELAETLFPADKGPGAGVAAVKHGAVPGCRAGSLENRLGHADTKLAQARKSATSHLTLPFSV